MVLRICQRLFGPPAVATNRYGEPEEHTPYSDPAVRLPPGIERWAHSGIEAARQLRACMQSDGDRDRKKLLFDLRLMYALQAYILHPQVLKVYLLLMGERGLIDEIGKVAAGAEWAQGAPTDAQYRQVTSLYKNLEDQEEASGEYTHGQSGDKIALDMGWHRRPQDVYGLVTRKLCATVWLFAYHAGKPGGTAGFFVFAKSMFAKNHKYLCSTASAVCAVLEEGEAFAEPTLAEGRTYRGRCPHCTTEAAARQSDALRTDARGVKTEFASYDTDGSAVGQGYTPSTHSMHIGLQIEAVAAWAVYAKRNELWGHFAGTPTVVARLAEGIVGRFLAHVPVTMNTGGWVQSAHALRWYRVPQDTPVHKRAATALVVDNVYVDPTVFEKAAVHIVHAMAERHGPAKDTLPSALLGFWQAKSGWDQTDRGKEIEALQLKRGMVCKAGDCACLPLYGAVGHSPGVCPDADGNFVHTHGEFAARTYPARLKLAEWQLRTLETQAAEAERALEETSQQLLQTTGYNSVEIFKDQQALQGQLADLLRDAERARQLVLRLQEEDPSMAANTDPAWFRAGDPECVGATRIVRYACGLRRDPDAGGGIVPIGPDDMPCTESTRFETNLLEGYHPLDAASTTLQDAEEDGAPSTLVMSFPDRACEAAEADSVAESQKALLQEKLPSGTPCLVRTEAGKGAGACDTTRWKRTGKGELFVLVDTESGQREALAEVGADGKITKITYVGTTEVVWQEGGANPPPRLDVASWDQKEGCELAWCVAREAASEVTGDPCVVYRGTDEPTGKLEEDDVLGCESWAQPLSEDELRFLKPAYGPGGASSRVCEASQEQLCSAVSVAEWKKQWM